MRLRDRQSRGDTETRLLTKVHIENEVPVLWICSKALRNWPSVAMVWVRPSVCLCVGRTSEVPILPDVKCSPIMTLFLILQEIKKDH